MDALAGIRQEQPAACRPGGHWYTPAPEIVPIISRQVIETQVVGVMFDGRQLVAAQLWLGEEVWLLREPKNRFDGNAIRVVRQSGRQIGYLNRHLAQELAPRLDAYGLPVPATVTQLCGDTPLGGMRIKFAPPQEER